MPAHRAVRQCFAVSRASGFCFASWWRSPGTTRHTRRGAACHGLYHHAQKDLVSSAAWSCGSETETLHFSQHASPVNSADQRIVHYRQTRSYANHARPWGWCWGAMVTGVTGRARRTVYIVNSYYWPVRRSLHRFVQLRRCRRASGCGPAALAVTRGCRRKCRGVHSDVQVSLYPAI